MGTYALLPAVLPQFLIPGGPHRMHLASPQSWSSPLKFSLDHGELRVHGHSFADRGRRNPNAGGKHICCPHILAPALNMRPFSAIWALGTSIFTPLFVQGLALRSPSVSLLLSRGHALSSPYDVLIECCPIVPRYHNANEFLLVGQVVKVCALGRLMPYSRLL